jgi:hypothetical protein
MSAVDIMSLNKVLQKNLILIKVAAYSKLIYLDPQVQILLEAWMHVHVTLGRKSPCDDIIPHIRSLVRRLRIRRFRTILHENRS